MLTYSRSTVDCSRPIHRCRPPPYRFPRVEAVPRPESCRPQKRNRRRLLGRGTSDARPGMEAVHLHHFPDDGMFPIS